MHQRSKRIWPEKPFTKANQICKAEETNPCIRIFLHTMKFTVQSGKENLYKSGPASFVNHCETHWHSCQLMSLCIWCYLISQSFFKSKNEMPRNINSCIAVLCFLYNCVHSSIFSPPQEHNQIYTLNWIKMWEETWAAICFEYSALKLLYYRKYPNIYL